MANNSDVGRESIIREMQAAYYHALSVSDKTGDATIFIEFALTTTRDQYQLCNQIVFCSECSYLQRFITTPTRVFVLNEP